MLNCNTITEIKITEFFEHIYPLKENIFHASVNYNKIDETHIEKVRKSKRQRKETFFENNFFTYLADQDPMTYFQAVSSSKSLAWKEAS